MTRGGRAAERRERELLAVRLLGIALADAVERAAVAREDLLHALRGPRGDVGDLLRARRGERVEDQLAALGRAGGMMVVDVTVDCCDAMGANMLNTLAEAALP